MNKGNEGKNEGQIEGNQGKNEGDEVSFAAPAGEKYYEVVEVRYE